MKIRYTGDDESRDLAVRGGLIVCPRLKWVDVEKEAEASGIPVDHALVVAREVVHQDDWETDTALKARKTRAVHAKEAAQEVQEPEADAPPVNEDQQPS